MKNQKFSKSPKFFAFYLESSKNVLPLRNAGNEVCGQQKKHGKSPQKSPYFKKMSLFIGYINPVWNSNTLAQEEKYRIFLEKQSSPPGYISSHPCSIKTCVVGVFRKFGCFSRDVSGRFSNFLDLSEKITSCQPRWISTFITKNDHVSTKFNITFQKKSQICGKMHCIT